MPRRMRCESMPVASTPLLQSLRSSASISSRWTSRAPRHALAGARETLARWSPRLALCTYHLPDDPEVIRREVFSANPGYREYIPSYPREQAYFSRPV